MEQKKNLSIRVDDIPCAWISNSDMTRLKYMLNTASWNWIINYLETGNPDDFRVFPLQEESLIAVFKFGKIYFRIRLTHPIVEYLNSNNI